jgi:hypothetical protein
MFSEKVNLLKIEIASHFGQIWPALSMWFKSTIVRVLIHVLNLFCLLTWGHGSLVTGVVPVGVLGETIIQIIQSWKTSNFVLLEKADIDQMIAQKTKILNEHIIFKLLCLNFLSTKTNYFLCMKML